MRKTLLASLLAGIALAGAAVPAAAINCYQVIDRNDAVIYRGTIPPIDLSEKGNAEREAMRKRGQQLIAMDVDRCLGVEYFTGAAGSASLSVDEIVGGIQMRGKTPGGYVPPSSGAGAPARAPSAAPAPRPAS
jgi:hypothetical protein